jgi:hypothetical protein
MFRHWAIVTFSPEVHRIKHYRINPRHFKRKPDDGPMTKHVVFSNYSY